MKKLQFLWRALVIMSRDMLTGFIIGLCSAVLLYKINPGTSRVVALLIPSGILAGLFKGGAKFAFMYFNSALPSKGYRINYPKYKLLGLWLVVLFITMTYSYGLNIYMWLKGPLDLFQANLFLGGAGAKLWGLVCTLVFAVGMAAHFYEPPYDEDEFLPPEEDNEDSPPAEENDGNQTKEEHS